MARGRDTDFRPHHPQGDPEARLVYACAQCRYAAYRRGWFGGEPEDSPEEDDSAPGASTQAPQSEELDALRRFVKSGELTQGMDASQGPLWEPTGGERFVLAARIHEFLREDDPLGAADYYLRASWCARAQGQLALERASQRDAISRFHTALENNKVAAGEKPRIMYLVGELSRRTGDFARAVDCFREVDKIVDPEEEDGAFLGKLARRQETLASIQSDVNAVIPHEEDPEADR